MTICSKEKKTKSNIFKQEFMDLTSEIQDQQKELQNQAKENNVNKNKHLLSKILNSEEDLIEATKKDILNENISTNKTIKNSQNISIKPDVSDPKVKCIEVDNLNLSDTKISNTEFKCTFDGCQRSFKTKDELYKHVSRRHKNE